MVIDEVMLLTAMVWPAAMCRRVRLTWADGGYAGKLLDWARTSLTIMLQVVKRFDDTTGFVVLPNAYSPVFGGRTARASDHPASPTGAYVQVGTRADLR
jgi:hypothetical protein